MKIVLLDGLALNPGDLSWTPVGETGSLTVYDCVAPTEAEVLDRIGDAEIVITNKTPLPRQILESCTHVKLVCILSTGYNVVDIQAAKELGIPVCNVPAYGTQMVAQFAIGLLLELCHHAWLHNDSVHDGEWEN